MSPATRTCPGVSAVPLGSFARTALPLPAKDGCPGVSGEYPAGPNAILGTNLQDASQASIEQDIAAINRIEAVPTILKAVTYTTGMRFAAVARVTESHWTACAVHDDIDFGLKPGGELVLETTICNEIRQSGKPVVFGHASGHPMFASHSTPALYGFESYISVPIMRGDGSFFGTLCAIDPLPAKLDDPRVLHTLELFAQLIAAQLDADDRLLRTDAELSASRDLAKLREQFIAVLGHDLRNPLQAISMAAEMLLLDPLPAPAERNVKRIQGSVERMSDLIHDVLDFARGRLGGGIPVALHAHADLAAELQDVVAENLASHPGRVDRHALRPAYRGGLRLQAHRAVARQPAGQRAAPWPGRPTGPGGRALRKRYLRVVGSQRRPGHRRR